MVRFKGAHYPKPVILYVVYFYVRYGVSYRDLEDIVAERGVAVDHATLNRWVEKYAGDIADEAYRRTGPTCRSWRMDETYIKLKGKWTYLYRALDKLGNTLDFILSERRDEAAATAFFVKAISNNGWPAKVVIDKSGSNTAGLFNMNCLLVVNRWCWLIDVLQAKYLKNIHRAAHVAVSVGEVSSALGCRCLLNPSILGIGHIAARKRTGILGGPTRLSPA